MMAPRSTWLLTALVGLWLAAGAAARPQRPTQIPNGDIHSCANCHVNPAGGGPRNDFGATVESSFLTVFGADGDVIWGPELAGIDSDGDGFTNGEELGDPEGLWTPGDPQPAAAVSLPGDPASVPPPALAPPPEGIPPFEEWLSSGDAFDVNGDGVTDVADWEAFYGLPPGAPPPGEPPPEGFGPDIEIRRGVVEQIVLDEFGGTLTLAGAEPLPVTGEILAEDGSPISLSDLSLGQFVEVAAVYNSAAEPVEARAVSVGGLPFDVPRVGFQFEGFTVLPDGREALLREGRELPLALGVQAFRDGIEIPPEEVSPGDLIEFGIRHEETGFAVVGISILSDEGVPPPGEEPFWDFDAVLFEVDPQFGLVRFEDFAPVDDNTEFLDEFGLPIDPAALSPGEEIVVVFDSFQEAARSVELFDPGRDYSQLFDDPDVGVVFTTFLELAEGEIRTADSVQRHLAIDVEVVDEATGEVSVGLDAVVGLEGQLVRASVRHARPGEEIPGELIVRIVLNPKTENFPPGGGGEPEFDFRAGTVAEIAVDDAGGRIRLEASPAVALLEGAEILDGASGDPIGPEDLQEGDGLSVAGHFDSAGELVGALLVVRQGPLPPGFPFGGEFRLGAVEQLADGRTVLQPEIPEWPLDPEVLVFLGPERTPLSPGDIDVGDEVELTLHRVPGGVVVTEVVVHSFGFDELPGDQPPPEPFWDQIATIGEVDPGFRTVRLLNEPIRIDDGTRFVDEFGLEIDPLTLEPGTPLVAQVGFEEHRARVVEIRDDSRDYSPLFEIPDIGVYFADFVAIEDGELLTLEDQSRPVAVDVAWFDEQTGEELTEPILREDLVGQFVRVRILHPEPGRPGVDVITEIGLNAEFGAGGFPPGGLPEPTEFFGEWPGEGTVARVELDPNAIVLLGMRLRLDERTEIVDGDGVPAGPEILEEGVEILVDPIPTLDPGVVVARRIQVDPEFPPQGFEAPLFTTVVLGLRDDVVATDGGWFPLLTDARLADGPTGDPLAPSDLAAGDFISYVVVHTDVGDFIQSVERDPVETAPRDEFWEMDAEVATVDELGRIRLAGPVFGFTARTTWLDESGNPLAPDEIPFEAPIVVDQVLSATGGPPVARRVEVQDFEREYEGFNLFFGFFGGVQGDLLFTTDPVPRQLALGAEVRFGNGDPAALSDLSPGRRVRLRILHPPPGLPWIGEVVARLVIDPERGEGPIDRPVEEGEAEGVVVDIDLADRILVLEGPEVRVDPGVDILDPARERLSLDDLEPGDLVAVNFFPARDFLRATKVALLDPIRVPQPRDGLLVAPVLDIDPVEGLLFLEGPFGRIAADAEIRDESGAVASLDEVEVGDLVRVRLSAGTDVPVIQKLRILGGFAGPIFGGGGLEIVSSFPRPGETNVETDVVEVTFNEPVFTLLEDEDFDLGILPDVEHSLDVSRDGRTLIVQLAEPLAEDTSYEFFVAAERFGHFVLSFTTGEALPMGAVQGRVILPEEIPFEALALGRSGVLLLDPVSVFAGEGDDPEPIKIAPFEPDGSYRFDHVPDGEFVPFAFVAVEFGPEDQLELDAFLLDDLGEPASIVVAGGGVVDGVDLTILPPEPFQVESTEPEDGEEDVSTSTEIVVEFSEPVHVNRLGHPAVSIDVIPEPVSGPVKRADWVVSEDGFTVAAPVELADATRYTILIRNAQSEEGIDLEDPVTVVATTGESLAAGFVAGRLSLPAGLPADRVILRPATVLAIPATDFHPGDPEAVRFAVGGDLSSDGAYRIEHLPGGDYVVAAAADVALPTSFRLSPTAPDDFSAFGQASRFARDAPPGFVRGRFSGVAGDPAGGLRLAQVGSEDVNVRLRPEDVRNLALRMTATDPDRESLLSVPSRFDLRLRFSEPLNRAAGFIELDAAIDPPPLSGPILENLVLEEDGTVAVFRDIELAPGAYRLSLRHARGASGLPLAEPLSLPIRTLDATEEVLVGSVAGQVEVVGDEIHEASVFLFDATRPGLEILAGGVVEADGSFLLEDIVAGEYGAFVEVSTVGGLNLLVLYDGDDDGEPDALSVGEEGLTGIDFQVDASVPVAADSLGGPNVSATLSFDLDDDPEDQESTSLTVAGGDTVDLAVYAYGVTRLTGVSVQVSFDTTQVEFVRALESPGRERHLLRSGSGAIPLFLPASVKGNTVEVAGAILSPTPESAATGDGPIALLRFLTRDDYTGATITLERALFNSLGSVIDTIRTKTAAVLSPARRGLPRVKGQVSFDFDPAPGDGGLLHLGEVSPGEEVSIEIYLNEVSDIVNYSVELTYDPEQLRYVTYSENPFLNANGGLAIGLVSPPDEGAAGLASLEVGASILGPKAGQGVTGSFHVGTVTFLATDGFSETDLLVSAYSFKSFGSDQEKFSPSFFARLSTEPIELAVAGATADFNSDGLVDFADFFLFADQVGADPIDARFDLNGDAAVDVGDFFIFAERFGGSGKAAPHTRGRGGELTLEARSADETLVVDLRAQRVGVRAYEAVVEYDPTAFRLLGVDDEGTAMVQDGKALLLVASETGRVRVSGARLSRATPVEGVLARLVFEPRGREARGLFRVAAGAIRQADGRVVSPRAGAEVEAGWLPERFALEEAFPNPFNPSTAIRYRLPVAAHAELVIYDVLGQTVRTLVDEANPAGVHRVLWDGRDDAGQAVGSGVYFSRLVARPATAEGRAEAFTSVGKLTLLK